jgi:hypothetical protein
MSGNNLANWRNFDTNIGHFDPLSDSGHQFCWRLVGNQPTMVDYSGPAAYFSGSPGTDLLPLGRQGQIDSFGQGSLGDGPDVVVYGKGAAADFRTGSSLTGGKHDNDLVIAGCSNNTDGSFDITTTSLHTGPGRDWVFIRNLDRSAVDAGNGEGGKTSVLDPQDGDDLIDIAGNAHDFRVFGGYGNDTVVWHVDQNVQTTKLLGPNFFGGGGKGDALFGDPGIDRLVLDVPVDTQVVTSGSTPAGALRIVPASGMFIDDAPTASDPYASYCVECGMGPGGRKTMIYEYRAAQGSVFTGYFYVTAFEELQIGIGDGAQVYRIDDVAGTLTADPSLMPFDPPQPSSDFCDGKQP